MSNPTKLFARMRNANSRYAWFYERITRLQKEPFGLLKPFALIGCHIALKYWAFIRWCRIIINLPMILSLQDLTVQNLSNQLQFLTENSNRSMRRKWNRMSTDTQKPL